MLVLGGAAVREACRHAHIISSSSKGSRGTGSCGGSVAGVAAAAALQRCDGPPTSAHLDSATPMLNRLGAARGSQGAHENLGDSRGMCPPPLLAARPRGSFKTQRPLGLQRRRS